MAFLILACFFLSGFGSLVYESLWTRQLTHVIGGSPYAVSIILAVFMGGLGLGGALGGRWADRLAAPGRLLKAYGGLEAFIGAYALALPSLLAFARPAFAAIYGAAYGRPFLYNALVFVLAALLLLPPVICMGATLPLLGRYGVRRLDKVGGTLGLLYALNTVGAALGVLAVGFWLFPALGLRATSFLAAALNAVVAVLAYSLGVQAGGPAVARDSGVSSRGNIAVTLAPAPLAPTPEKSFRTAALWVFALSGFCAMAYEVVWTKVLGLIMGPTVYAFTVVLAVFILGLALGGWLFGKRADRSARPAAWLAATQGGAALLALAASQRMGNALFLFEKIDFLYHDAFIGALAMKGLFLALFMFPPTVLLGAAFPLCMRLAAGAPPKPAGASGPKVALGRKDSLGNEAPSEMGRSIGGAYAANTFGGVIGSWLAGFALIPAFGSERALGLLAALQALSALVLGTSVLWLARPKKLSVIQIAIVTLIPAAALLLSIAYPAWDHAALSRADSRKLGPEWAEASWWDALWNRRAGPPPLLPERQAFYGDGIGGFTSVWESRDLLGGSQFSLFLSGKADASSRDDMFTQLLLAHFPMLLHPHPRDVMVLGLASGVTAGEVLHYHPDHLDVLEINPQVAAASDFFLPWNNHVLSDPCARLIVQDAKAHLLLTDRRYDVIISEPSNPWMAGLSELFSREFFQRARDRLRPGGILVEFLHSYQMDWPAFSMIGRTFAETFPVGALVRSLPDDRHMPGSNSDYLLVGVKGDTLPMLPMLSADAEKTTALAESQNVDLSDPRLLYRMVEATNLPALFGPGPLHTDDKPELEFAAPRLRFLNDSRGIESAIAQGSELPAPLRSLRDSLRADPAAAAAFAEYALSVGKPFTAGVDWAHAPAEAKTHFADHLAAYCTHTPVHDLGFLPDPELHLRCSVLQMAALNKTLKTGAGSAVTFVAMAELCLQNGAPGNALKFYRQALELSGEASPVGREASRRISELLAPGASP